MKITIKLQENEEIHLKTWKKVKIHHEDKNTKKFMKKKEEVDMKHKRRRRFTSIVEKDKEIHFKIL